MKRNQIITGFLFVVVILFTACSGKEKKPDKVKDPKKDERNPNVSADDNIGGMIPFNLAVRMSKAYKNSAAKVTVDGIKVPDAVNIKFSLERLKSFMARIENSFPAGGCKPELGIRFYYVRYPENLENTGLAGLSPMVANHHSLMMVPFYVNEKGQEIDFNVDEIGDPCNPTPYYRTSEASRNKPNLLIAQPPRKLLVRDTIIGRVLNHGGLTPPPDDETGTFPTPSSGTAEAKISTRPVEQPAVVRQQ